MKVIETTVYEFDELTDEAKEIAREWYRNGAMDYEWWDSTFEDAANIGLKITSFDLERNRHAKGQFTQDAPKVAAAIIKEHGPACETHKTATAYLADLAKLNSACADVDGDDETNAEFEEWQDKRESLAAEFEKSLLEDYSIMLQQESLSSNESVDEGIKANGYTFTESGKRYG